MYFHSPRPARRYAGSIALPSTPQPERLRLATSLTARHAAVLAEQGLAPAKEPPGATPAKVTLAGGTGAPGSRSRRVRLALDGEPVELPDDLAGIIAALREHLPAAAGLTPELLFAIAVEVRSAVEGMVRKEVGFAVEAEAPLLVSAWPGRNRTEKALAMLRSKAPTTPLSLELVHAAAALARSPECV